METTQAIRFAQVKPHNTEAETAVLGSILIDPEVLKTIEFLLPEDFYIERNRWIYLAALELRRAGQDVDYLTVCQILEKKDRLREAGGPARVMELLNATPTTMHVESYARMLQEE